MRARRPLRKTTKPSRKVQWEPDFIPWGVGIGMIIALAAEVYWHGNVLWMASGGLVGGAVGVICDTALFLYRLSRSRRQINKALHR